MPNRSKKGDGVREAGWLSWLLAAVAFLVLAGIAFAVRGFAGVFRDFDTELPALTSMVIRTHAYVWVGAAMIAAAAIVLKDLVVTGARARKVANVVIAVLLVVFAGSVLAAVMIPLMSVLGSRS